MMDVLDEVVLTQERGEARGIVSVCSAHPWVLRAVRDHAKAGQVIVEATCNQVNQFGGYTGMRPADFVRYVAGFDLPGLLGGDHLGPSVWQAEPAEVAMAKAEELVRGYVQAGFTKIHLDASMRLGDDPAGALDVEICARRAARLVQVAEAARGASDLRYVIGTEVPVPGGAHEHEVGVAVTTREGVQATREATRAAFRQAGVEAAWERVRAVVVQPGVEYGDDFVLDYQPEKARGLAQFIEGTGLVYEAHSTDYQTREALRALVQDHFAILKVGPALTFAFREAVFALAMMEGEMVPRARSNLIEVLDAVMVKHPAHWRKYYHGTAEEQAFKRKFSLSDRARYYWGFPEVQAALARLLENMRRPLPMTLLSQFVPGQGERVRAGVLPNALDALILDRIGEVLRGYLAACGRS